MKKLFDVIEEIYNKIKNQDNLGANANLVITFFLSGLKQYKESILITKEEYKGLLEDKLILLNDSYNKFELNDEEYEKNKKEIKEKIEYLK